MRHAVRIAAFALVCSPILALSACGSEEISLAKSDPYYKGAEIFDQRCAGCHTLSVAGAYGSNVKASDKEISDGPNFNQRAETEANVLYALRNGGFSGKIMPANIVTGEEAKEVARFLAKYAGSEAKQSASPTRSAAPEEESTTPATTPEGDTPPAAE
ncbi:MAG: cytochrome c [Solirubrobacteraceae bacterium]|nr:cytochrome c [Solirubrobacteraceae bacterium]